jgi:corrinoid protein of di/trimethylamine methyltransferase
LSKEEVMSNLARSVIEGNPDAAAKYANEAIKLGISPLEAIEKGLAEGVRKVGELYEKGELFLTELMMGANAMQAGVEVLKPEILKEKKGSSAFSKIVIGTVEGDIHDIGKTIVKTMLVANSFEVIDLGVDVPNDVFIKNVKDHKPRILCLSSLLTTTKTKQKEVIEALEKEGLRDKVKVMVGGAAVTPEWAEKIGADGYAEDGADAAKKAKALVSS